MTSAFRSLSAAVGGEAEPMAGLMPPSASGAVDAWAGRWRARLATEDRSPAEVAAALDRTNPLYVPRNRLVEDALAAAGAGDLAPYERLVDVVTHPYEARPGCDAYAEPSPPDATPYRTFCGT
jgi:uncharacterized protein YdiU (UPF0061 family)